MSKPAAISATLVDVRNVAAHKAVRLEIHVPAEQAPLVMEAFGWPTMVDPVPVAIARLGNVENIAKHQERRRWEDLKLAAQASIRCTEPAFWRFLNERFPSVEDIVELEQDAASVVRLACGVSSRSELNLNHKAAELWRQLESQYQTWLRAPQHA